jgi:sugar phosphate isomerase/epimerase
VITRRSLAVTLAGGITRFAARAAAATRLNIGIGTYTYHSLSIDAMIAELTRLGILEIEMSRGEFMLFSNPPPEIFQAVKAKLDEAAIRCVSYYTATIRDDRDLGNAVRFAKLLGAGNVTGDATGDILQRIDRRFTEEGLTFGIHNHYFKQKFAYESPEDVLRALAGLSQTVGASLDVGHIASCGYDTVDAVRKLAPRLKMVHLKDVQAAGGEVNVLLGKGIAQIPQVMGELRKAGYTGLVAIEYEHDGPVEEDVRVSVAYARKLA